MAQARTLTHWGRLYLRHLQEHRPKLYAELEAKGRLESTAYHAQEAAKNYVAFLISEKGENAALAQSEALRMFILLPDEETVPDISQYPFQP